MIVEDHPIVVQGYISAFNTSMPKRNFCYETALNCKEAYQKIQAIKSNNTTIDVALVDMSLPKYPEKEMYSGLDVGLLIKKHFPTAKIIIATAFTDVSATKTVLEKLCPEALVCKTDITTSSFIKIFELLNSEQTYISESIRQSFCQEQAKKLQLDTYDFEILHYINKGVITKELSNYINLSLSAIEKRKASLKFLITGKKCSDTELITKAKELHLLL